MCQVVESSRCLFEKKEFNKARKTIITITKGGKKEHQNNKASIK